MVHGLNSCLAVVDVLTASMRHEVKSGWKGLGGGDGRVGDRGDGGNGDGDGEGDGEWVPVQFTSVE